MAPKQSPPHRDNADSANARPARADQDEELREEEEQRFAESGQEDDDRETDEDFEAP